ncbi:thiopurine S-methyltransferase [Nitrosomonas cryotolerans]|uniref:Thiopurine S-methyltransferase n=1 Tax=Nitrosomonas cryotolerans ATCC 49181 TaxID=1131553 RepID=A0A1N6I851_9PROT|nr:thiopurine S-methyltransferase [Nitrosomonas cryotolerans]SFP97288.1 thiopurine S-methyltransferase [Nitrosomonas cryotolerans]SIO28196.1 thiopurine S-methyltransferase [Nitrosomonas cryotolerans ATCC 49181]
MKNENWLRRWKQEAIGFHQDQINPYLRQYWPALNLSSGSEVFVPLCGKSRDMLWLRQQAHAVLGVELSPIAVQAFFRENNHTPQRIARRSFDQFETTDIRILCGDFFDLSKADLAKISAVYDRASLVALPPAIRKHYVRHLLHILPPATQILLITFDYPQTEMSGPPFSVTPDEVTALYHEHVEIKLLTQCDVLAQNPRFQKRGLSRAQESIFMLTLPD